MKQAYLRPLYYFLFWLLFFVLAKGVFLAYHYPKTAALSVAEIAQVFWYGLWLDISFSAYLCVIPFFCFFLESLSKQIRLFAFIRGYTLFFSFLIALVIALDLELYRVWGFRLDLTPLQYLNTPAEMLASAAAGPIGLLMGIFILFTGLIFLIYLRFFQPYLTKPLLIRAANKTRVPIFLCLVLLIFPMRGCSWHVPVNQSDVYFSNNLFANHAAINLPWNVLYYLTLKDQNSPNRYTYLPENQAQKYLDSLYFLPASQTDSVTYVLKNKRPNILFIILESYTAKLMGCLGGEPGVTPNLDSLAREGLLFTNMYASGDRSEKGLVALLSAYPVQTTASISKLPRKTEHLPHLNKILKTQGYRTSYYYGGELAFANIKSYLVNAGYDKLVSKFDFNANTYNSKWGVHDHVLLDRWLEDLKTEKQPFFSTLFTLSSHEPYEIPISAKFTGSDEATLFKNSVYYTDYAIGNFIRAAKKQAWWHNTLIVMAADHGHRFPGDDPNYKSSKFRIPFLLTGGALKHAYPPEPIIGSQTDIVPTLLHQLGLPTTAFKWGKNLLARHTRPFAFYVFNDGFGYVTPTGVVTFDNVAQKVISRDAGVTRNQLNYGKAYLQLSFADYLNK